MCNNQVKENPQTGFNAQLAYSKLAKRHQDLSDFMVKFVSGFKPQIVRTAGYGNLMTELERIVGGVPTDEFPECCLIGTRNVNGTINWFCTGVLVHPKLVLSAAHCILPGRSSYVVALNSYDQNKLTDSEIINVRKTIVNPKYDNSWKTNDIAGFVLQTDAKTTPVEIASTGEIIKSPKVILAGFGNDDINSSKGFGLKRKVTVDIVSIRKKENEDLNAEEAKYGFESDLEFVAGGNGFDTCNGDSGGPIYISLPSSRKIAGLTSRATINSVHPCGDGGIYTRVDVHKVFIDDIIKSI